MHTSSDVHVIGGGLAGLTAAALVSRAGLTVTVHDARTRLGGQATTDVRHGFAFDLGAHALYRGGAAERVLRRLGIDPQGAVPPRRGAMGRRRGEVHPLPGGPWSLLRTGLLSPRDRAETARLLLRLPRLRPSDHGGETVAGLLDRHTDRPAVRDLALALVRLTSYVDQPDALSADAALTQLRTALTTGVWYLAGGWEQLVRRLLATPGVQFAGGDRVTELPDAPAVIVAVGGPAATARLTGRPLPDAVPADVSVLDVGLRRAPRHRFVLGVDEPFCLTNQALAAGRAPTGGAALASVAYLRPGAPPVDETDLEAFVRSAGFDDDDVVTRRYLRRMTAVTAIPTADAGGLAGRPPVADPDRPGVFVAGDWVGPEGHLADAVFASAEAAARAAISLLARWAVPA